MDINRSQLLNREIACLFVINCLKTKLESIVQINLQVFPRLAYVRLDRSFQTCPECGKLAFFNGWDNFCFHCILSEMGQEIVETVPGPKTDIILFQGSDGTTILQADKSTGLYCLNGYWAFDSGDRKDIAADVFNLLKRLAKREKLPV